MCGCEGLALGGHDVIVEATISELILGILSSLTGRVFDPQVGEGSELGGGGDEEEGHGLFASVPLS